MHRDARVIARSKKRSGDNENKRRREIVDLRNTITTRISQIPKSWVNKYTEKLADNNINPSANINQINNIDNLRRRRQLLPPPLVYQHMRSAAHPSIPEHRAASCKTMARHTRDYVKSHCDNDTVISTTTGMPISIKRFAPHNINAFRVNGKLQCLSKALLKHLHKSDYTLSQSYQRDAYNDEWPELLATPTNVSNFRIPYHVMEECDMKMRVPSSQNRRAPPHETRYQGSYIEPLSHHEIEKQLLHFSPSFRSSDSVKKCNF